MRLQEHRNVLKKVKLLSKPQLKEIEGVCNFNDDEINIFRLYIKGYDPEEYPNNDKLKRKYKRGETMLRPHMAEYINTTEQAISIYKRTIIEKIIQSGLLV